MLTPELSAYSSDLLGTGVPGMICNRGAGRGLSGSAMNGTVCKISSRISSTDGLGAPLPIKGSSYEFSASYLKRLKTIKKITTHEKSVIADLTLELR